MLKKYLPILFFICLDLIFGINQSLASNAELLYLNTIHAHPIPDYHAIGNFETITLPIKRAQNLILIEAQIDTLKGNFILDTGAPYLVLNKTYFRTSKRKSNNAANGIVDKNQNIEEIIIPELKIQDLTFQKISADVINLGNIENKKGVKILGLLGTRLFKELAIEIDLRNNVLLIHRLDKNGNKINNASIFEKPELKIPFSMINEVILFDAKVANSNLRFCLDTGAELNVFDQYLTSKVINTVQISRRVNLSGTGNEKIEVLVGKQKELKIAGQSFYDMETIVTNLESLNEVYGQTIDGIIGYEWMSKGILELNFVKKEMSMYFYKE